MILVHSFSEITSLFYYTAIAQYLNYQIQVNILIIVLIGKNKVESLSSKAIKPYLR